MFPPGNSGKASLHVSILPFLEQQALYDQYDFRNLDDSNVRIVRVPLYLCPSDPASPEWPLGNTNEVATNYAGNSGTGVLKFGFNGMFRHFGPNRPPSNNGPIRARDVANGLSNTAAISEILHADGTYTRLRVNWFTPTTFCMIRISTMNSLRIALRFRPCRSTMAGPAHSGCAGCHGQEETSRTRCTTTFWYRTNQAVSTARQSRRRSYRLEARTIAASTSSTRMGI